MDLLSQSKSREALSRDLSSYESNWLFKWCSVSEITHSTDLCQNYLCLFWLAFGLILLWLNHIQRRQTLDLLPHLDLKEQLSLGVIGIIGGVLSSIYGNGVDLCTFAYVTMRFELSEKVATPTSVLLMASNAVFGVAFATLRSRPVDSEVINFWLVSIPVVLLGAPLGAKVMSRISRLWIANLLYALILIQFIAAILIIRPSGSLLWSACLAFLLGLLVFALGTRKVKVREASGLEK